MSQHDELINILNQAVALEYTAVVQYNQHSMLLTGKDRRVFEDLFKEHSLEALGHAKMWGDRIVYLGGVPKAEVGAIQQSTNLTEMLEMDLEIETKAVEVYSRLTKSANMSQPFICWKTTFWMKIKMWKNSRNCWERCASLRQVRFRRREPPVAAGEREKLSAHTPVTKSLTSE
jgi:bacterioferritin